MSNSINRKKRTDANSSFTNVLPVEDTKIDKKVNETRVRKRPHSSECTKYSGTGPKSSSVDKKKNLPKINNESAFPRRLHKVKSNDECSYNIFSESDGENDESFIKATAALKYWNSVHFPSSEYEIRLPDAFSISSDESDDGSMDYLSAENSQMQPKASCSCSKNKGVKTKFQPKRKSRSTEGSLFHTYELKSISGFERRRNTKQEKAAVDSKGGKNGCKSTYDDELRVKVCEHEALRAFERFALFDIPRITSADDTLNFKNTLDEDDGKESSKKLDNYLKSNNRCLGLKSIKHTDLSQMASTSKQDYCIERQKEMPSDQNILMKDKGNRKRKSMSEFNISDKIIKSASVEHESIKQNESMNDINEVHDVINRKKN